MLRCSARPQLQLARRYGVAPCHGSACLHVSRPRRFLCVSTSKLQTERVVDTTPKAKAPRKESQAAPAQVASRISDAAQAIGGVPKVVLKRGKTALFRGGHPMVYSGAVDRVLGKPQPVAGDSVMVTDGAETPIGWGVFNPNSMFRVRIMQLEEELTQQDDTLQILNMPQLIAARIHTAIQLRTALGLGTMLSRSGALGKVPKRPKTIEDISWYNPANAQQELFDAAIQAMYDRQADRVGYAAKEAEEEEEMKMYAYDPTKAQPELFEHAIQEMYKRQAEEKKEQERKADLKKRGLTEYEAPMLEEAAASDLEERQQSGAEASSSSSDVYRVVNSEGDRLSGLIVDRVGDRLVVSSSAAWVERYRDVITQQLVEACKLSSKPVWRQAKDMLKEEGMEVADADSTTDLKDPAAAQVKVGENGVKFWVAPSTGQKTGFYADQRDSRMALRPLAKGRTVLDLCCYTGGFALNALAGGATHVTGIDSSAPALELAESNACLNGWAPGQYTFLKNDIAKYMQQQIAEGNMWDFVVLDPPKLAPNRKSLTRALTKYRNLNSLAMQVLRPGGMLMTCSCSGAVALNDHFLPVLKEAARVAGRHISIIRTAGAGPDHPIDPAYPEGAYLKNVLLLVT